MSAPCHDLDGLQARWGGEWPPLGLQVRQVRRRCLEAPKALSSVLGHGTASGDSSWYDRPRARPSG
jgi:hypothetical protein